MIDNMTMAADCAADQPLDPEQAVLRRCLAGDWTQYGWLVERYRRLVWAAVDAVVDDPASVPDVVQEVFIRVYEKLDTFRFRCSFSSWLWRLSRNYALSWRRNRLRRPQWSSLDAPRYPAAGADSPALFESRADATIAAPDAAYYEDARERALSLRFRQLPPHYREVMNLYYLSEMPYEQIAGTLNLPLNTVRTHLRRGRLKLAELLEQDGWNTGGPVAVSVKEGTL
jgi:RNA polymerase sigma-70 factor (ECF subfamily)